MLLRAINSIIEKFHRAYYTHVVMSRCKTITPPTVLGKVYVNAKKITLGRNVTLYPGVYFWGNDIEIGDNVAIGLSDFSFIL